MKQIDLAYKIAKTQLGISELSGDENPMILKYHGTCLLRATNDETPWCSAFMNWCVLVSGMIINPFRTQSKMLTMRFGQSEIDLVQYESIRIAQQFGFAVDAIDAYKETRQPIIGGTFSASARSWITHDSLLKLDKPQKGSIVVLTRGNDGISGHVGFVENLGLTSIDVLGGNQGDKVCIKTFLRKNVICYMGEK